ncbi:MAG: SpoIIE family protein phosphatase [Bacteroidota bacterium]
MFNQQLEQERLKKEMELASNVQKMLIPDELPKGEGYELASIYKPHFTVGGDYYDFIKFNKNQFAFCIADISGKGVGAAILMANFQAILQGLLYRISEGPHDLAKLVRDLNEAVFKITKADKFITFFIVEVDLEKKELQYVNAGHFPPFMIMDEEIIRLDQGCTILGCFEELPDFEIGKLSITDEAILMAFTDGLIDLQNDNGEYFDESNIGPFMKLNNTKGAEDFNNSLLIRLDEFKQQQDFPDDIAVITCKLYADSKQD